MKKQREEAERLKRERRQTVIDAIRKRREAADKLIMQKQKEREREIEEKQKRREEEERQRKREAREKEREVSQTLMYILEFSSVILSWG